MSVRFDSFLAGNVDMAPPTNSNAGGVATPTGAIAHIKHLPPKHSTGSSNEPLIEHIQAIDKGEFSYECLVAEFIEVLEDNGGDASYYVEQLRQKYLNDGNDPADWFGGFNPLVQKALSQATAHCIAKGSIPPPSDLPSPARWKAPSSIDAAEWASARPRPDTIVVNYLYADVAILIAPGGVGKTTLVLYEAVCIVRGVLLYGMRVVKSGPVLILTSEDSREMLIARLREIVATMGLMGVELKRVMDSIYISDVSGEGFKLTKVENDVVVPAGTIDQIIDGCREIMPVLIVIDPAVSFGIGEARVNDAEQGLVEAARKLRNALNCCVRYVHHSGKQNAREGAVDQYAGRGGSAFADGARMVSVLQTMKPDDWTRCTGTDLADGEVGLRIARPKLSYAPPQSDIFVLRRGYHFQHIHPSENGPAAVVERNAKHLLELLSAELNRGHYRSRNTLEQLDHGLNRNAFRKALASLESTGVVEDRPIPNRSGNRGAFRYLHPLASPSLTGEANADGA
jgi:RecA-family ATPase